MEYNVERIQQAIDLAKAAQEKSEKLEKLFRNPDFKELIVDGFMTENAARSIRNSVCTRFDEQAKASLIGSAQAAGHLSEYFELIKRQGQNAHSTIRDNTNLLLEVQHTEG